MQAGGAPAVEGGGEEAMAHPAWKLTDVTEGLKAETAASGR